MLVLDQNKLFLGAGLLTLQYQSVRFGSQTKRNNVQNSLQLRVSSLGQQLALDLRASITHTSKGHMLSFASRMASGDVRPDL
jgi:hypothetical protein